MNRLICRIFGHKWERGIATGRFFCRRCNKPSYDTKRWAELQREWVEGLEQRART